ncbi:L-fuculose-phosphate aldolase [Calorimonas adulescens]|jgi:L-fuculose 1-phosphate aldolase (EC 4.1.2.17)|uniref:L-fuculose-phosphate aldolase n=1 Tax=Calorimonas adulescens TaxID=2606906 RepID=A0A5D8Q9H8_9THEO|nr:L-fuculose-phosphate aldolase [Calorimonas adulescens]TZE81037.1 L-fuculose-phosphate aldolase [Calorimonas adulescens]
MLLEEERNLIVAYGKNLITHNLTTGTGGNLSIFNKKEGLMAISPSGIDYFETKPEDVVIMDLEGKIVDGTRKPSSEYEMHRIFYRKREDVGAVVHTHSTYSTVISCLRWTIPAVHYLVAFAGKDVRCAEYATFGTREIAENAFEGMKDRNAVLLANHGLLAVGPDLPSAFNTAEEVEFCAEIYYRTKCIGEPVVLPDDEMELMMEKFKTYGQKR